MFAAGFYPKASGSVSQLRGRSDYARGRHAVRASRGPAAVNEPSSPHAPGSPERAKLQAALRDLAARARSTPMFIDGREVQNGEDARHPRVPPARADARRVARGRRACTWARRSTLPGGAASGRRCRGRRGRRCSPEGGRSCWRASTGRRSTPRRCTGSRRRRTRLRSTRACELIDFWRYNAHFAQRFCSDQPSPSPGVEPLRPPPLEGFVPRRHALQLHLHRRQPPDRARPHGQHRRVEAQRHRDVPCVVRDGGSSAGRACPTA